MIIIILKWMNFVMILNPEIWFCIFASAKLLDQSPISQYDVMKEKKNEVVNFIYFF